ncbi:MAG: hypothetical protein LBJ10_01440 [Clostridiales bacterium]|jgi:hypothetical protein|nr:hypothetical protein [Clostridiales bacterium]
MIKIGMIDRWLNNWHTDHYPDYLRLAAEKFGFDADVTDVWAQRDAPGGLSTEAWCALKCLRPAATQEELFRRVDAVMVMCADDCLPHEELAWQALAAGKPLYCDKTFAPDVESARRMFLRANAHGTPVYSCSAQRYCMELMSFRRRFGRAAWCATTGPGDLENYSVHQFEMIEYLMGAGAESCRAEESEGILKVVCGYGGDRSASFAQGAALSFAMEASPGGGHREDIAVVDYYMSFMFGLLKFFSGDPPPVAQEDTMEVMALQQAARQARRQPGLEVPLPDRAL